LASGLLGLDWIGDMVGGAVNEASAFNLVPDGAEGLLVLGSSGIGRSEGCVVMGDGCAGAIVAPVGGENCGGTSLPAAPHA